MRVGFDATPYRAPDRERTAEISAARLEADGGLAIGFAISVLREPGRIPLGNIFASLVAILVGFFAMLCSLVETLVAVGVPVSERSATALGRWLASKERRCVPPLPPALPAGERENGVLVRRLATA